MSHALRLGHCTPDDRGAALQVVLLGDASHTVSPVLGQVRQDSPAQALRQGLRTLASQALVERLQGCNCGLEDAAVFSEVQPPLPGSRHLAARGVKGAAALAMLTQVLKQHPQDLDAALRQYTQQRLPDVLALVRINQVSCLVCAGACAAGLAACPHAWAIPDRLCSRDCVHGLTPDAPPCAGNERHQRPLPGAACFRPHAHSCREVI